MHSIGRVLKEYESDIYSVQTFCTDLYEEKFAENFKEVRELYKRMKSKVHPITDSELEYILTTFPMELFVVAESLNRIRLNCEVVKLKNKETLERIRREASDEATKLQLNKSQSNEFISHVIAEKMVEYEVLFSAYNSVITRVENELTFSKELIMGAKKIWDSRRSSENSNPVGMVVPDLPEYKMNI